MLEIERLGMDLSSNVLVSRSSMYSTPAGVKKQYSELRNRDGR